VHLNVNFVRIAWMDPASKDIKSVWETRWGDKNKIDKIKHSIAVTKVKIDTGIKELIFVFPTFIVAIRHHFEYNYNHFNYIFNPKNLPASKKSIGSLQNIEIDVVTPHFHADFTINKLNIIYTIVDTKQLRTYSQDDKKKATISAITNTLIEFQIPEINFRGNNIDYTADLKGNGIMISKNSFEVVPKVATDKIELLDELYGQSLFGTIYKVHTCDMVITKTIVVSCEPATKDLNLGFKPKQLAQANNLHGIYTAFENTEATPDKQSEVHIVSYIKKAHEKPETLSVLKIDFKSDLNGKPELVSMGVGKDRVTIFAINGTEVSKREISDTSDKSKESFDM
jgi:hypothetical protein